MEAEVSRMGWSIMGGGLKLILCLSGRFVTQPGVRDRGQEGWRTHSSSQWTNTLHTGLMMTPARTTGTDRTPGLPAAVETCFQTMLHSTENKLSANIFQYRDPKSILKDADQSNQSIYNSACVCPSVRPSRF